MGSNRPRAQRPAAGPAPRSSSRSKGSRNRAGRSAEARAEAKRVELERRRKRRNLQFTIAVGALIVAVVAITVVWQSVAPPAKTAEPQNTASAPASTPQSVAPTPQPTITDQTRFVTGNASSRVLLVEFLDFECEGCAAVFPVIEKIKTRYDPKDFAIAVKYYPGPSHPNSKVAARAVEAAAKQGKFVEMYQLMFETQREWGEQQTPMDDRFADYAKQLGLDLAKFEADRANPATDERIQADIDEGQKLGVDGTPTFYLDGARFQPQSEQQLTEAIDAALKKS